MSLYKSYVRPHLEFALPIWSPWLQRDVDVLEKVQEKFVKNISGLRSTTYSDKLNELELLSLSDRQSLSWTLSNSLKFLTLPIS